MTWLPDQHRNFLTLNKECSAEGLWAVIQDRTMSLAQPERHRKRPPSRQLDYDFLPKRKTDSKREPRPAKKAKFRRRRKFKGNVLPLFGGRVSERIKYLEFNQGEPTGCLRKGRTQNELLLPWAGLLVQSEYFVPALDQAYIRTNEFQELLQQAGIPYQKGLSRSEWAAVRKAIGRPPLFTQAFIDSESARLQASRNFCRKYMLNPDVSLAKFHEPGLGEALQRVRPFEVNQVVLAQHPQCQHLHYGLIFSKTKENNLMIKFLPPELGVQKVPDHLVSLEFHEQEVEYRPPVRMPSEASNIVNELDFKATAFAYKLLESKSRLVHLHAQRVHEAEAGWLVELIGQRLEEGESVPHLLYNTLGHMHRSLEAGFDPADRSAAERAKHIITEYQEREVAALVQRFLPHPPQGEAGALLQALLGILAGFRVGGRLLTSTKEFKRLVEVTYQRFP
ncbi:unnamed protein product [Arctogadus glacialis]